MSDVLFKMGQEAHANQITIAAHDKNLMAWLQENTTGEVGSAIPHLKEWKRGFEAAVDKECEELLRTTLQA